RLVAVAPEPILADIPDPLKVTAVAALRFVPVIVTADVVPATAADGVTAVISGSEEGRGPPPEFNTAGSNSSALIEPSSPPATKTLLLFRSTLPKRSLGSLSKSTVVQVPAAGSNNSVVLYQSPNVDEGLPPIT